MYMNDGTIIRKEFSNTYRTNHYEIIIDDLEALRLSNSAVDLSYKNSDAGGRIATTFYYTDSTAEFFDGNDDFLIGSQHSVSLRLHNNENNITRYVVENEIFTIKEKRLSLGYSESNAICFELVFVKE